MCLKFEKFRKTDWKSYFWEIWVQYNCFFFFFFKHFISYLCILFIKYYALGSICIKLLCLSKNWFFPDFWLIEPVARLIEITIKKLVWIYLFQSVLDRFWINQRHFQSIKHNFQSIKNCTKSFLKLWVFTCSITSNQFFVVFP